MITDFSDLMDQLEDPNGSLSFEIDASLRSTLHASLQLGLKLSLQHPASQASPKAMIKLEAIQVRPTDVGAGAFARRFSAFEYKGQQPVSVSADLINQASGWLEYYCSGYEPSRQYPLAMKIYEVLASQPGAERVTLPLAWVHEAADWVEGIARNDAQYLSQSIRKDILESHGIAMPSPFGSDDDF